MALGPIRSLFGNTQEEEPKDDRAGQPFFVIPSGNDDKQNMTDEELAALAIARTPSLKNKSQDEIAGLKGYDETEGHNKGGVVEIPNRDEREDQSGD